MISVYLESCCCSITVISNSLQHHRLVHQALLSLTVSWGLLKFTSIKSVMLSNHLILCHPFSFYLQSFFLPSTQHQDISDELAHQVVKILALQLQQQSFQ